MTAGIELFLSTEKAVDGANKFRAAVDAATAAVDKIGTAGDKLDETLVGVGAAAGAATAPLKQVGTGAAGLGKQLDGAGNSATQFGAKLGRGVAAQNAFAGAGRTVASVLRLLEVTPAAKVIGGLSEAFGAAGTASRGFSALLGATPWATVIGLAGAAATAFFAFGGAAEDTGTKLRKVADDVREAEAAARRFDQLRLDLQAGESGAGASFLASLKRDLVELNDELRRGTKDVPIARVLAAIEQQAPETVQAFRKVADQIVDLGKAGKEVPRDLINEFGKLSVDIEKRFGLQVKSLRESLSESAFSPNNAARGFAFALEQSIRAVGSAYDALVGKQKAAEQVARDANRTIRDLQGGKLPEDRDSGRTGRSERERASALDEVLGARLRELELLGQTEDQQKRIRIEQESYAAALKDGRAPTIEQLAVLGLVLRTHERIAATVAEEKRAKSVGEVLAQLRRENELLEQQGTARQALQRAQQVEIELSRIKGGATDDERKQLDELLAANKRLLDVDEQRRQKQKEFARDTKEANRAAEEFARAAADATTSAFERLVIEGAKARDVARALYQDFARLALRQSSGVAFQYLFEAAARGVAGYFASTPSAGAPVGSLSPGAIEALNAAPRLTGGTIPAMGGQVVDEFSFLRRGRNTYSVAEGGRSTPEAIFPLQRDERGRLGVAAAGGGGGDTIHMSFPGIRTQSDMRAARMTMGQQLRKLRAAERGGRRGLRPRE